MRHGPHDRCHRRAAEQGRLLDDPTLAKVASRHGATPAQVASAWVLRQDDVNAIPRSGAPAHVRENHDGLDLRLDETDLTHLDRVFPPPSGPRPLDTL